MSLSPERGRECELHVSHTYNLTVLYCSCFLNNIPRFCDVHCNWSQLDRRGKQALGAGQRCASLSTLWHRVRPSNPSASLVLPYSAPCTMLILPTLQSTLWSLHMQPLLPESRGAGLRNREGSRRFAPHTSSNPVVCRAQCECAMAATSRKLRPPHCNQLSHMYVFVCFV